MKLTRSAALFAASAVPAAAAAAETAHAEAHVHAGIPWLTLLFSTVNFLLFAYVLRRFAWPLVRDWVRRRQLQIVADLETAARAKREAEQLKAQWEGRQANLAAELEELRRAAREDIAREREQILAAAREAAAAIQRDARRVVEQEVRSARAKLREEIARKAFDLASSRAREGITPVQQDAFLTEFLKQVRP